MKNFLPYGKQCIEQDDIDSVVEVLKSDFLTQGPAVANFEAAVADYVGAKYAVAVSNGTAALHMAVLALDIEHGAEGITSPNTFLATSNALIYAGLKPVFADIDDKTYNIDINDIERVISDETKVVIPVHFAGRAVDVRALCDSLAEDVHIIEDAAHAIGSEYSYGGKVGNCLNSDMTIFSFHPVKTITAAEGGVITTNSKVIYDKLCLLRSHGVTKNPDMLSVNPGPWYYEMVDLGFNYRMTDIQAALGLSQLKKLDDFAAKRRSIVNKYNEAFAGLEDFTIPDYDPGACYHLYTLRINFEKQGLSKKSFIENLKKQGIGTQVHYIPVYSQPYYKTILGDNFTLPNMEKYYAEEISLPLYPGLDHDEVEYIITTVKKELKS